jgi:hypothetical protein
MAENVTSTLLPMHLDVEFDELVFTLDDTAHASGSSNPHPVQYQFSVNGDTFKGKSKGKTNWPISSNNSLAGRAEHQWVESVNYRSNGDAVLHRSDDFEAP